MGRSLRVRALTPVAMSEADAARTITQRVEQLAASDRFSGAVLVVKGNRVLVSTAKGHADKAFAVPNRIDTKFNLGSMNKMFTAVAIGQLVEKGKMSFTDTLAKVLLGRLH
jgi:CubicO group peptidase (beta-lactamase class C family)